MNILPKAIVSDSDMIKNYRDCREKTEKFNKIFILKNNQPDAVLFSISEYQRFSAFIEYAESIEENRVAKMVETLPKKGNRKIYSFEDLLNDIKLIQSSNKRRIGF